MKKPLLPMSSDWTFDKLKLFDEVIAEIAVGDMGLDVYTNQIEVITSEQMLDAYSSHGMPMNYSHWSFGKSFIENQQRYLNGQMGLAYEIVLNSDPCIAYLMEENTMAMQTLVMAHASYGHNSVFKNNYLFQQHTDASGIVDYLMFARDYVATCTEKYGHDRVEHLLDACHALQNNAVDYYTRPEELSKKAREREEEITREFTRQTKNNLFDVTIGNKVVDDGSNDILRFPADAEDNFLYFFEKYSPILEDWEREIVRIVRKTAQYFLPQRLTKVTNEGFACLEGESLIDTESGLMKIRVLVESKYGGKVWDGTKFQNVVNWFTNKDKKRIRIEMDNGYVIWGGDTHKIFVNGSWMQLDEFSIGDEITLELGHDHWPSEYIKFDDFDVHKHHKKSVSTLLTERDCSRTLWDRYHDDTYPYTMRQENQDRVMDAKAAVDAQEHKDSMAISTRHAFDMPPHLTPDFGYWLGYLIGDGHISEAAHSVGFTIGVDDQESVERIDALTQKLFNIKPTIKTVDGRVRVLLYSMNLITFLKHDLGLAVGRASHYKSVPELVLQSPRDVVAGFIRGYFDADGCATKGGMVIAVSVSRLLLSHVQDLLLKFGIWSQLTVTDWDYHLNISGKDADIYGDEIGFALSRKQDRMILRQRNNVVKNVRKIRLIEKSLGTTYDFSVEETHQYRSSAFTHHNCFTHYHILEQMNTEGSIDERFMFEIYASHNNVIFQPGFDDKRFSGINPYALGFAIYQDIRRMCEEPTKEDELYFPNLVGKDWRTETQYAMKNFKDDGFIAQYLSPKVIRDFRLFSYRDDKNSDSTLIKQIHDEDGYRNVVDTLSNQHNFCQSLPQLAIVDSNPKGSRELVIQHNIVNKMTLELRDMPKMMAYIKRLWGFDVTILGMLDDVIVKQYHSSDYL